MTKISSKSGVSCVLLSTVASGYLSEIQTLQRLLWVTLKSQPQICNSDLPHTLPDPLGDELKTLLAIIHPSEELFAPSWSSFSLAALDSAETLAWASASSLFVPRVQLSLLELFRRFSVKTKAGPVSRKQPPSLEVPEESICKAVQAVGWLSSSSATVVWTFV